MIVTRWRGNSNGGMFTINVPPQFAAIEDTNHSCFSLLRLFAISCCPACRHIRKQNTDQPQSQSLIARAFRSPPNINMKHRGSSSKPGAAPEEHQQLAHTIKRTHRTLRERTQRLGAQQAWQQHLQDGVALQEYANAMRDLATRYWDANSDSKAGKRTRSSTSTEHNRIAWSVRFCEEYFFVGGTNGEDVVERPHSASTSSILMQQREREERIRECLGKEEGEEKGDEQQVVRDQLWTGASGGKLRLLDVGSCYNPFVRYANRFDVTAVDIAPAAETGVKRCDFLALQIDDDDDGKAASSESISRLPGRHFDVVVFSLLLEYMPTSEQRLHCCSQAYRLLRPEGILIIITPDSKHVGANARLIKTWHYALALLGLSRVRIEKLEHLTCMVFRRAPCAAVARRWAQLHREPYMENEMRIPQDAAEAEEAADSDGGDIAKAKAKE